MVTFFRIPRPLFGNPIVKQKHRHADKYGALCAIAFLFDWDDPAVLLAGAFPGVTWRGFRHTLE